MNRHGRSAPSEKLRSEYLARFKDQVYYRITSMVSYVFVTPA